MHQKDIAVMLFKTFLKRLIFIKRDSWVLDPWKLLSLLSIKYMKHNKAPDSGSLIMEFYKPRLKQCCCYHKWNYFLKATTNSPKARKRASTAGLT